MTREEWDAWDHPRSRGVYPGVIRRRDRGGGSSPLARGLLHDGLHNGPNTRIIPARAGFTSVLYLAASVYADHPRSRGVYPATSYHYDSAGGSSPLARGLLTQNSEITKIYGIIPARAGFTIPLTQSVSATRDHPRSRGVYLWYYAVDDDGMGSSPLARGLHMSPAGVISEARIIPARAGFTRSRPELSSRPRDHPRSRGVYKGGLARWHAGAGSSPLARGLRVVLRPIPELQRIIPARAGFTTGTRCTSTSRSDHPRSRGVYQVTTTDVLEHAGSSPLARGLRTPMPPRGPAPRIIPARAGFTHPGRLLRTAGPDHPRSRGVYSSPR